MEPSPILNEAIIVFYKENPNFLAADKEVAAFSTKYLQVSAEKDEIAVFLEKSLSSLGFIEMWREPSRIKGYMAHVFECLAT